MHSHTFSNELWYTLCFVSRLKSNAFLADLIFLVMAKTGDKFVSPYTVCDTHLFVFLERSGLRFWKSKNLDQRSLILNPRQGWQGSPHKQSQLRRCEQAVCSSPTDCEVAAPGGGWWGSQQSRRETGLWGNIGPRLQINCWPSFQWLPGAKDASGDNLQPRLFSI